jgi:hypothetical protein
MQLHGSAPGHKSLLTGELGFAAFCMMLENAQGVKKAIARINALGNIRILEWFDGELIH